MLSIFRRHFSIYLEDGFSLLAFTSITAPLKVANEILGYKAYTWSTVTEIGGEVTSSCGVTLHGGERLDTARKLKLLDRGSFLVLLLGSAVQPAPNSLVNWIRECLVRGICIGGIGRGALVLAENGLLDGRRCSVHWNLFDSSVEAFPRVLISKAYFEIEGLLHTCAGEAASFDLMLEVVKSDFGSDLRDTINEVALQGKARTSSDRQIAALHVRLERMNSRLLPVVQLMERTIAEPLAMDAIVTRTRISRRQLERLFQQQLGMSPSKFYCQLRLERAHALLKNSGMPIVDVAISTGFQTHSHFTRMYRAAMDCTPQETRAGRRRDGAPIATRQDHGFPILIAA